MFKHLFATMNEVLDQIISEYQQADGVRKSELDEQLSVLKAMSDTCIEEWLLFEEKLGRLYGSPVVEWKEEIEPTKAGKAAEHSYPPVEADLPAVQDDRFEAGQGYYKLCMYDKASSAFERIVQEQPDFLLARAYLAMSHLRTGNFGEAYRQFQLLLPLTENTKMKAISYNAMGCIQAEQRNFEKACEYFLKAYRTDPTCVDPVLKTVSWPRFS